MRTILPWMISTVGIPALLYGIWFQTEGLFLVSWDKVLLALIAGTAIGFCATRYIGLQSVTGPKDMYSMIYAYEVTFFLCILITYISSTVLMFLIGSAGTALAIAAAIYYTYWFVMRKKGHILNADKNIAK